MEQKQDHEFGLAEYIRIVRKRMWLIVVIFVLSVTGVTIASFRAKPIYQATALLRIEYRRPNIVSIEDVYLDWFSYQKYHETQYRLIKSRNICSKVFERLRSTQLKQYANSKDPVESFVDAIKVDPIPDTHLVNVSYESGNPEHAAGVINAVVDEYVLTVRQEKRDVSEEAETKITEQIPVLRKNLLESQAALQEFEHKHSALSFEKRRAIIYDALSSLSTQLTSVKQEIAKAKAKYKSVVNAEIAENILSLPSVVNNPAVRAYREEMVALETRKAKLAQTYKPGSDPVKVIDREIEVLRAEIQNEASRIARSIEKELEEKESEEKELQPLLNEQRELAKSFDVNMSKYDALKAEVEGNRKLYEEFVQRQKELQSSAKFDISTVQIVNRAEVPKEPVRPRKTQNVLLAGFLSLLAGIALAFLLEHMDDSIKSREDVDRYVKLPLLGVVPSIKAYKKNITEKDLLTHRKPKSAISEAYGNIRTSLLYALPNAEAKAYVITSAGPQEGKTTTAINLSIALALAGRKVLLVDSDFRKPRIHKTFKTDGARGLTNCLVGEEKARDLIVETEIENLSFMPSGPIPSNPAELLDSARMKELMTEMKESFDSVILDSSPLVAVSDAAVLAAQSDGVIQVILAGGTSRKIVELGKERIENTGAKIIGVVLNNMRVSRSGYYYYYPRYYKYYGVQDKAASGK